MCCHFTADKADLCNNACFFSYALLHMEDIDELLTSKVLTQFLTNFFLFCIILSLLKLLNCSLLKLKQVMQSV